MWGRKKRTTPQKRIDSLIGAGTMVSGDVTFSGGLRIDGRVQGNVVAANGEPSTLVISEQATVDGEVAGDVVVVGGSVRPGPKSVVRGEVTAVGGRIETHPAGRVLNGTNEVGITWPDTWGWNPPGAPNVRFRLWPAREWWAGFSFLATSVRLGLVGLLGLIVVLIGGRLYDRLRLGPRLAGRA